MCCREPRSFNFPNKVVDEVSALREISRIVRHVHGGIERIFPPHRLGRNPTPPALAFPLASKIHPQQIPSWLPKLFFNSLYRFPQDPEFLDGIWDHALRNTFPAASALLHLVADLQSKQRRQFFPLRSALVARRCHGRRRFFRRFSSDLDFFEKL